MEEKISKKGNTLSHILFSSRIDFSSHSQENPLEKMQTFAVKNNNNNTINYCMIVFNTVGQSEAVFGHSWV